MRIQSYRLLVMVSQESDRVNWDDWLRGSASRRPFLVHQRFLKSLDVSDDIEILVGKKKNERLCNMISCKT